MDSLRVRMGSTKIFPMILLVIIAPIINLDGNGYGDSEGVGMSKHWLMSQKQDISKYLYITWVFA